MAQGLPVIASNVGGVPEIIDEGVNGYLVPPGDEISLADAMVRMIDKGNRGRYVMGLKNKEKIVQLFSSERMIEDYSDIYKNVLMIDS